MKLKKLLCAIFLFNLSVLLPLALPFNALAEAEKVSLAIFPFNSIIDNSLDMQMPALLHSELSQHHFIEIVPVEVIRETIYDIEPQFMWTEKKDSAKKGGILWKIEPGIVEKVNDLVTARFSIYGDVIIFNGSWNLNIYVVRERAPGPEKTFRLSGVKGDEIPFRMGEVSKAIVEWLREENALPVAEEDIRQYRGGMFSYDAVVKKLQDHVNAYPGSIPLRALLLELYLNGEVKNGDRIVNDGLIIMRLLERPDEQGRRYLLSLNLDPFDAVADVYEDRGKLEEAITVRNAALRVFQFNEGLHKKALGEDYFRLAGIFETAGRQMKAAEHFRTAIEYLDTSSQYYNMAIEGMKRLNRENQRTEKDP